MKRLFLLMGVAMTGVVAQAATIDVNNDGKVSLEEWINSKKAYCEKSGAEYKEATVKATFERYDLNKDGFLSGDEKGAVAPTPAKK